MSTEPVVEPEVEELVLPGLVEKKDEEGKEKADKVTGQRLNQLHLGNDSDDDLDAEDEEDVSLTNYQHDNINSRHNTTIMAVLHLLLILHRGTWSG